MPGGSANAASTYASAPFGPTSELSVRPPSARSSAPVTIVLPAPVSPVSTVQPGAELQVGVADHDEVGDDETLEHQRANVAR